MAAASVCAPPLALCKVQGEARQGKARQCKAVWSFLCASRVEHSSRKGNESCRLRQCSTAHCIEVTLEPDGCAFGPSERALTVVQAGGGGGEDRSSYAVTTW